MGLTRPDAPFAIFVVVSHDCDIAQLPDTEPFIEVVVGRPIGTPDGNYTHAKNPRKLHLPFAVPGGESIVEMLATEKIQLSKEVLADFEPDRNFSLSWERLSTFQRWLAARYRRAAFPDAFNARLDATGIKDKLSRILAPLGEYIHAIFFDVDDGEEIKREAPEDTYTLDIYLLYDTSSDPRSAQIAVTEAREKIIGAFRDKLYTADQGWRFIELRDCVPMSDDTLTYRQSLLFKKWNIDYVSLRDPSQAGPVE